MVDRPPRMYWVKKPQGKDILVFDRGHERGSAHVYELKEQFTIDEVKEEYRNLTNSAVPMPPDRDLVALCIEKKYGFPMTFDLS